MPSRRPSLCGSLPLRAKPGSFTGRIHCEILTCGVDLMRQSVALVTLGVSDYARSKTFYESLGWSTVLDIEETAFFQANGVILVLWARDKLAADLGIEDDGAPWGGIALAHNVGSREVVHEVIEQARTNGAEITREPAVTFYGGYAGAFR